MRTTSRNFSISCHGTKEFQQILDSRLKDLQSKQQPFKKQAKAISITEENEMWIQRILGTHSFDAVINTLVLLTGKLFVLRGGK